MPLCDVCRRLSRPPILSYDGYAFTTGSDSTRPRPIALGNIDTIQNFVHLYDEHWFILVHVEIEADRGGASCRASTRPARGLGAGGRGGGQLRGCEPVGEQRERQIAVLRRIPEKMDPALYYKTFRPYIRFFETCGLRGSRCHADGFPRRDRSQSSIMPTLVALMKIPHRPSLLTNHLADMQNFMPQSTGG